MKKVLFDICGAHPFVLKMPAPVARLSDFCKSSLDLRIICHAAEYGRQWTVAEELRMEIYKRFDGDYTALKKILNSVS